METTLTYGLILLVLGFDATLVASIDLYAHQEQQALNIETAVKKALDEVGQTENLDELIDGMYQDDVNVNLNLFLQKVNSSGGVLTNVHTCQVNDADCNLTDKGKHKTIKLKFDKKNKISSEKGAKQGHKPPRGSEAESTNEPYSQMKVKLVHKPFKGGDKEQSKTSKESDESIYKPSEESDDSIGKTSKGSDESIGKTSKGSDESIRKPSKESNESVNKLSRESEESVHKTFTGNEEDSVSKSSSGSEKDNLVQWEWCNEKSLQKSSGSRQTKLTKEADKEMEYILKQRYVNVFDHFHSNALSTYSISKKMDNIRRGIVMQALDHFNILNLERWPMRYLFNDKFFRKFGPVFIFIGGNWHLEDSMKYLHSGLMYNLAKKHNGMMYATEHRYYGQSAPFADNFFNNFCGMEQLSIKQAISDLYVFVNEVIRGANNTLQSKVILIGSGYAGTLAAWMRLEYPQLIDGVISSSAPHMFQENFNLYYKHVDLNLEACSCSAVIKNATWELERKLRNLITSIEVKKDFRFCSPIDISNSKEITYIFLRIMDIVAAQVIYGSEQSRKRFCKRISGPKSPYKNLAKLAIKTYKCFPSYQDLVQRLQSHSNERSWFYQQCKQIGSFRTSENIPLTWWSQLCKSIFEKCDKNFLSGISTFFTSQFTKMKYESEPARFTKVVSTHGSKDPWSLLGIRGYLSPTSPIIMINGASHSNDLNEERPTDPPELKQARKEIMAHISLWIK